MSASAKHHNAYKLIMEEAIAARPPEEEEQDTEDDLNLLPHFEIVRLEHRRFEREWRVLYYFSRGGSLAFSRLRGWGFNRQLGFEV